MLPGRLDVSADTFSFVVRGADLHAQLEAEYREKVQLYWRDQEDPDVDCSDAITAPNTHRNRYGP